MAFTVNSPEGLGWYANLVGSASGTTGDTAITITHGLGVTPRFVLATSSVAGLAAYTADSTSVTITAGTNQDPKLVAWIISK
jgi:hypothetical protein